MQVWTTIWNIIVFILCLSFVVCIHEAGHLAVAKLCNVYCFEYSIGFGPILFKHKFKHKKKASKNDDPLYVANDNPNEKVLGETQLSIRALPLGGYVSMAGEDGNLSEDGKIIPTERTLPGVNHFKQICIMLAGITMNFILAIFLFIISCWIPKSQNVLSGNSINVVSNTSSITYEANEIGLQNGDKILYMYQTYDNMYNPETKEHVSGLQFPVESERVLLTDYQIAKDGYNGTTYDEITISSIAYASQDIFTNYNPYKNQNVVGFDLANYDKTYSTEFSKYVADATSTRTFTITYQHGDEEPVKKTTNKIKTSVETINNGSYYTFGKLGIQCLTTTYNPSFGEAFINGNKQFGSLFVNLYSALGSLFTPSGWKNVGGIISVYKMSAQGTQSGSISYFLLLWGYISLNLGCFNLLPFPGLDGWQTLIALIESISRKKVPSKVKGIANTVGLIIMFVLAALLVVKDIVVGVF